MWSVVSVIQQVQWLIQAWQWRTREVTPHWCQREIKICSNISEIQGWKMLRHLLAKQQYIKLSSAVQKMVFFWQTSWTDPSRWVKCQNKPGQTSQQQHRGGGGVGHGGGAIATIMYVQVVWKNTLFCVSVQTFGFTETWTTTTCMTLQWCSCVCLLPKQNNSVFLFCRLSLSVFFYLSRFFPLSSNSPPPLSVFLSSSLSFSLSSSLSPISPLFSYGLPWCFTPPSLSFSQHITAPSLSFFSLCTLLLPLALPHTHTLFSPSLSFSIYILPSPIAASLFSLILSFLSSLSPSFPLSPPPSLSPGPLLFIPLPLQSLLFQAIIRSLSPPPSLSFSLSLPLFLWLRSLLRPHFVLCHFTPSSMFSLSCCLPHPRDVWDDKVKSNDWLQVSKCTPTPALKYTLVFFDVCWIANIIPQFHTCFMNQTSL